MNDSQHYNHNLLLTLLPIFTILSHSYFQCLKITNSSKFITVQYTQTNTQGFHSFTDKKSKTFRGPT